MIHKTCGADAVVRHKFKIGDRIVCVRATNSQLGELLKLGETYIVSGLSGWHGMDCVFLEGLPTFRQLADRFVGSSNGKTQDFESCYEGSNPSPTA